MAFSDLIGNALRGRKVTGCADGAVSCASGMTSFMQRGGSAASSSNDQPLLQSESGEISMTGEESRFAAEDSVNWKKYMEEHGFVVIKDVLSDREDFANMEELLWDVLEKGTKGGWKRDDPETWKDTKQVKKITYASLGHGIVNGNDIVQSDAVWAARKKVYEAKIFQKLWDDEDVCTSIDGVGIMRPWFHGIGEKTKGGWFHVDQSISLKGKMKFVQGMLSLYPQNQDTGSFTVIDGSHKYNKKFGERITEKKPDIAAMDGDVVYLSHLKEDDKFRQKMEALPKKMIKTEAGDFVLWDSRTLHCSTPSLIQSQGEAQAISKKRQLPPSDRLLRSVFYIWMKPKACFSEEKLVSKQIHYVETGDEERYIEDADEDIQRMLGFSAAEGQDW